ncbi:MAG: Fpg/Nei family DNA glycosylase [Propionibacteriales bacterium]|nr:Fpg/Nei family DNA glycosylase [Propionibacteriales bacterium]
MPELPEVEALAEFLTERAVGRLVTRIDLAAFSVLKTFDPPVTALHGLEITAVNRLGKFLDVDASGLHLVTHLARGGWLRWREQLPATPARPGKSPLAVRAHLDDGSGWDLTEMGTQKRLAIYVVGSPYDVPGIARLGPDPLSPGFDVAALASLLEGTRQQLKGLLRDQSVLAGVGNAYSDEVLHAAKMSPFRLASSLSEGEVTTLHRALIDVLTDAVARSRGLGAADLKAEKKVALRVHGRTGEDCSVCGDTIREVAFADSAMQYCPTCQTGGKPLADRRLSRLLK